MRSYQIGDQVERTQGERYQIGDRGEVLEIGEEGRLRVLWHTRSLFPGKAVRTWVKPTVVRPVS